jgi:hypothetical protein
MFRTPYLVRIKVLILNQSKIFNYPFSNDKRPSFLSLSLKFLVNHLPTSVYSTYKPLILDGFLRFFCVSLLIWQEQNKKLPTSLLIVATGFDEQGRRVFIPHSFSYLHLSLISFKCIIFVPTSFLLIIMLYLFSFLIIPLNFLV